MTEIFVKNASSTSTLRITSFSELPPSKYDWNIVKTALFIHLKASKWQPYNTHSVKCITKFNQKPASYELNESMFRVIFHTLNPLLKRTGIERNMAMIACLHSNGNQQWHTKWMVMAYVDSKGLDQPIHQRVCCPHLHLHIGLAYSSVSLLSAWTLRSLQALNETRIPYKF